MKTTKPSAVDINDSSLVQLHWEDLIEAKTIDDLQRSVYARNENPMARFNEFEKR